jgi:hypothetical protein
MNWDVRNVLISEMIELTRKYGYWTIIRGKIKGGVEIWVFINVGKNSFLLKRGGVLIQKNLGVPNGIQEIHFVLVGEEVLRYFDSYVASFSFYPFTVE